MAFAIFRKLGNRDGGSSKVLGASPEFIQQLIICGAAQIVLKFKLHHFSLA
jgi:hypothetical protein